jgi:hypothetical protein
MAEHGVPWKGGLLHMDGRGTNDDGSHLPVKRMCLSKLVSMIRAKLVIVIELALDPAHMEASCRACGRSRRERGH